MGEEQSEAAGKRHEQSGRPLPVEARPPATSAGVPSAQRRGGSAGVPSAQRRGGSGSDPTKGGEPPLTTAVATAVRQWQRRAPQWVRLCWSPYADRVPRVPSPPELETSLFHALMRAESNCRARGEAATARIEMARHGDHLQVTLSCLTECWRWAFAYPPGFGGQPRQRAKHRVILPATAPPLPRPWDEADLYDPICVLSCNPATIEMVRSLLYRLPCRRLWHTASARLAQAWLDAHPRCPLWFEDRAAGLAVARPAIGGSLEMPRAERGNERQCRSCAANPSPPTSDQRERPSETWRATPGGAPSGWVPPPLTATPIWLVARKIFPWPPGIIC